MGQVDLGIPAIDLLLWVNVLPESSWPGAGTTIGASNRDQRP